MGFEYMFVTTPPTPVQWQGIIACFEQATTFCPIATTAWPANHRGLIAAYAYAQPVRLTWPEDFYVSVEDTGIYLLFQGGFGPHASLINQLTTCLLAAGLAGKFEEL